MKPGICNSELPTKYIGILLSRIWCKQHLFNCLKDPLSDIGSTLDTVNEAKNMWLDGSWEVGEYLLILSQMSIAGTLLSEVSPESLSIYLLCFKKIHNSFRKG